MKNQTQLLAKALRDYDRYRNEHTARAVGRTARDLWERNGGQPIAVSAEHTKGLYDLTMGVTSHPRLLRCIREYDLQIAVFLGKEPFIAYYSSKVPEEFDVNVRNGTMPYMAIDDSVVTWELPETDQIHSLRTEHDLREPQPLVFREKNSPRIRMSFCCCCGEVAMSDFIVTHELWKEVVPKEYQRGLIHLECFEKLMDRPLTINDFKDVPLNKPIRFGYRLAQNEN